MSDEYAAIAASNILSALIGASQSPKDLTEVLDMYDKIFDHIATHQQPRQTMTINPAILHPTQR